MCGTCNWHGEMQNEHKISLGKLEEGKTTRETSCRQQDIEINLKEIEREGLICINLAQDLISCGSLVKVICNRWCRKELQHCAFS